MLRLIYMGTPYFAVPALEMLIEHAQAGALLPEGYEIVTVITRPDKTSGRGKELIYSPVKELALAHNLPIWQPGSFKRSENVEALAAYQADLYIVAAFGQILPQAVLDSPRYGTLNIHASLLPKYRGASPISEAILQDDSETGVSIMLLDAGIDTGSILLKRSIPIAEDETTESLTLRLALLGAEALKEALPQWIAGTLKPEPQDEEKSSHTRMLHKEDGVIVWERPAAVLARMSRAYTPWPGLYTHWHGKLLKIVAAHALPLETENTGIAGMVTVHEEAGHRLLAIVTGSGYLAVEKLQLEGKKVMSADEFLRGYGKIVGEVLAT